MERLKVEGREHLVRDPHTNAIINTDNSSRQAYRERIRLRDEKDKEIAQLKYDVSEMKKMLNAILNELKTKALII